MTPDASTQTSPPAAPAASQLSPDFPWPGFAPYQEADRSYFHGRKQETEEVLRLISRDVMTLVVGPTGVGKTSLVQCALVPALLEDGSLPVVVRLDWFSLPPPPKPASDEADTNPPPSPSSENPLTRQLISALQTAAATRSVSGPTMREGETLWEYFHREGHRWWSNRQHVITPVLIIDRFEEAFTVGTSNATARRHAERFFQELSELASNRPPVRLSTRIEKGEESGQAFVFETVPVRVLLILREEFTARLVELRNAFPNLRRSQFRLAPFSTSQARDAIQRSAAQRNLFADGAVDAVVEFLASEGPGEETILPAHLSVVCSALSIERAHRGGAAITRDFLAVRPGRLMHDFITAAVSDLPPAARALMEEHLTDLRGNSQRVPLSDALSRSGLPREALDTLIQRHLVRIDSLSSNPHVSLAHDLLAGVLSITRLERVAQAREQSAVLHQAQAQAQIQAQAATVEHKVRQQRTVTWMIGAAAVLITAAAIVAAVSMSRNRNHGLATHAGTPVATATPSHRPVPTPLVGTSVAGNPTGSSTAHPTPNTKSGAIDPGLGTAPPKLTPAPSTPNPPPAVPNTEKDSNTSFSPNQETTPIPPKPPPTTPAPLSGTQTPSPRVPNDISSLGAPTNSLADGEEPEPDRPARDPEKQARVRYLERRERAPQSTRDEPPGPKRVAPAPRAVPPRTAEVPPPRPKIPLTPKPTPRPTFNRF